MYKIIYYVYMLSTSGISRGKTEEKLNKKYTPKFMKNMISESIETENLRKKTIKKT